MIQTRIICDFCNQALPVTKRETPDGKVGDVVMFKTKECNTAPLFPHLCENCATKLDLVLRECTASYKKHRKAEIAERMRRINDERRKKLGSKG